MGPQIIEWPWLSVYTEIAEYDYYAHKINVSNIHYHTQYTNLIIISSMVHTCYTTLILSYHLCTLQTHY